MDGSMVRLIIAAAFVVVALRELDELVSGVDGVSGELYSAVRPLIVSGLLCSVYQATRVESK